MINNVLISTAHGTMIVNRNEAQYQFGVTRQLVDFGVFEPTECAMFRGIISKFPTGCIVLDVGANIGVMTLEFAKGCAENRGTVISFEPQRIIYNMLCGNVALASLENVFCHNMAIGDETGSIKIPRLNYSIPSSYGSLELGNSQTEDMGQVPEESTEKVPLITIDSMNLPRLDMLKIDVEGMEVRALNGAENTISAYHPVIIVEWYKSKPDEIKRFLLRHGYSIYILNKMNWVASMTEIPSLNCLL